MQVCWLGFHEKDNIVFGKVVGVSVILDMSIFKSHIIHDGCFS